MEEKMSFFQKFKNALYNAEAYITFLKQGLGKAILYIFILSLFLGGLVSIKVAYEFNKGIAEIVNLAGENIPDFRIQNGKLSVDATMPIIYKDSDFIIIVDTENAADISKLDGYSQGILISEDEMYSKQSTGKVQLIEFKDVQNIALTGEKISEFLMKFKVAAIVVIVVAIILGSFLGKLLSLFIVMGLLGLIVAQIVHCKTDYETNCKLGAYALTVPMLIKCIVELIGIHIPYFFVIYYGIALFYVGRALKAIDNERNISTDAGFME